MTVQNPAVFLQSEAHPAEDVRRMLTAIAGTTGGVVDTGALAVSETAGAASMGVDVAGGRAWIAGSEATYQGVYFVENRGVESLTIGASDPTNGRYDLIVAKVEDSEYSGSVNAWSLVVVAGTADPSPVDPATPANSITLARVTVGAGVSTITDANITDLRNVVGLEARVADLETPPADTKTASYTLAASDKNTRVVMNSASATTITVDTGIFSAGDSVWIHNIGAGTCTVTAGTATVDTAGSLDVGQWEGGSLYFTSASSAIFFRGGGAVSSANFTDTATGTYTDGGVDYKYITFTSSGTLTVDTAGLVDILLIGGGGGGGDNRGGGGGAGGMWETTGGYLEVGTHTVIVAAGGAGGTRSDGRDGFASRIGDYWMPGGGAGTAPNGGTGGHNGASGGGGSYQYGGFGGTGIAGLGNNGGSDSNFNVAAGGGGGGAGANGSNGSSAGDGGNGGAGRSSSITGTAVTYAGGGGGGGAGGRSSGSGGSGGGGAGGAPGGNGTANTGSGGGGGYDIYSYGGNGASGLVIVRVEV
jgi:hypothetical protein